MRPIPTLRTIMFSDFQPFADSGKTVGTGLTGTIGVDEGKVHPTLPAHPCHQKQKLSKCSVYTCFALNPFGIGRCRLIGTSPIFGNLILMGKIEKWLMVVRQLVILQLAILSPPPVTLIFVHLLTSRRQKSPLFPTHILHFSLLHHFLKVVT